MTRRIMSAAISVIVLAGVAVTDLSAQTWSDEQQEVWTVVLASWEAAKSEDLGWVDTYVHTNALGWSVERPMPRSRDAVREWERFNFENSTTLVQTFHPVGIVVEGATALVMYYYQIHVEDAEGKRENVYGRCAETWIGQSDAWLLFGWMCIDAEQDD